MFEFLTLLVFGVIALRSEGTKRVLSLWLITLLILMDTGAHSALLEVAL